MNRLITLSAAFAKTAFTVVALMSAATLAFGDDAHEHQHSTTGPKGGVLVELGDEELHAEVLHDDEAGTVTVYLLDSEAKRYVSVTTPEIVISVRTGRRTEQFRLKSKPQKGDRQGQTSRYELKSPTLVELLDGHDAEAKLSLKIGKRSFVGVIPHVHDHEHGHAHSH